MAAKYNVNAQSVFAPVVSNLKLHKVGRKSGYVKVYADAKKTGPGVPCIQLWFGKDNVTVHQVDLVNFTVPVAITHKHAGRASGWHINVPTQLDLSKSAKEIQKDFYAACRAMIVLTAKPAATAASPKDALSSATDALMIEVEEEPKSEATTETEQGSEAAAS